MSTNIGPNEALARQPKYSNEEAAQRGNAIYEREIRSKLAPEDQGKYVAIDIDTHQWAMDSDEMLANACLRSRIPEAQIWMTRVGYGYTRRFGAAHVRRPT